jgi:hypothetical protein
MRRHGVWAVAGSRRGLVEVPITFTRADASTLATYLDQDGLIRTAAPNVIRPDYSPYVTGGLVFPDGSPAFGPSLEGSRQNLIENGDYEVDAVGSSASGGSTIVRDSLGGNPPAIKPGTPGFGLKITTANSSSSGAFIHNRAGTRIAATVGTAYTFSQWVYAPAASVGKTVKVRIEWWSSAPAFLSATEVIGVALVAGWQRLSVSGVAPASTATADPFIGGDTAQGVWDFWVELAQFEAGAFRASPIPTGTAAVTRAADSLLVPINFGPTDITVFARVARSVHADASGSIGTSPGIFALGGASPGPRVGAFFAQSVRSVQAFLQDATGNVQPSCPIAAGTELKVLIQAKNFGSASTAKIAIDSGDGQGLTAFSDLTRAITAYGAQTLRVGLLDNELYGVLLDLIVFRGLFTLAEASAVA